MTAKPQAGARRLAEREGQAARRRSERSARVRARIRVRCGYDAECHQDQGIAYIATIKGIDGLIRNLETEIEDYHDK